mmetsp:Transcript_58607/g.137713  ORF Transcript_58607/g.137713 Transcript_58607/m.137713 type:complete len:84 (+) Transcript_58607:346-597(+)
MLSIPGNDCTRTVTTELALVEVWVGNTLLTKVGDTAEKVNACDTGSERPRERKRTTGFTTEDWVTAGILKLMAASERAEALAS